jgi:hypothetical protein
MVQVVEHFPSMHKVETRTNKKTPKWKKHWDKKLATTNISVINIYPQGTWLKLFC